jgi:hypothetical protein
MPAVRSVAVADGRLHVEIAEEQGAAVNRALAEAGLYASAIVPKSSSLEDVFLELTGGDETGKTDGATAA